MHWSPAAQVPIDSQVPREEGGEGPWEVWGKAVPRASVDRQGLATQTHACIRSTVTPEITRGGRCWPEIHGHTHQRG